MPTMRLSSSLHFVLVTMTLAGCPESSHGPDADGDAEPAFVEVPIRNVMDVDLLFAVDNSNSMTQEQAALREQVVVLLGELMAPGMTDAGALGADLHVGVVTSDLGTSGFTIQTCSDPETGDDGVLASICRDDWTEPFQEIARAIQRHLGVGCVELPDGVDAAVDCRLVEVLDDGREVEVQHVSVDPAGWDIVVGEACPGGQLRLAGEPVGQDGFVFECRSEP
jgi:hypothetical protein